MALSSTLPCNDVMKWNLMMTDQSAKVSQSLIWCEMCVCSLPEFDMV